MLSAVRPTIMDKNLGTNLHLWRFITSAKQSGASSAPQLTTPPPPPPYNVGHVYTLFLKSFNIVWEGGGEETHFETENSAFLKLSVKNTENKCNYTRRGTWGFAVLRC